MRKIFLFFVIIFFIFNLKIKASDEITIMLDGELIDSDVAPEINNSRTMVPVAVIGKTLGVEVVWENASRKVEISKGDEKITLFIDNPHLYITGGDAEVRDLDAPPYIKNGRTMLPLRQISEIFNLSVEWDNDLRRVLLSSINADNDNGAIETADNFTPSYLPTETPYNKETPAQNSTEINKEPFKPSYLSQEISEIKANNSFNPNFSSDKPTLKNLLKNAMLPAGRVLYIYGGAWNEEDTGSGREAMSFGLAPGWLRFFETQDSSYNAKEHSYEIHSGLDCSGFIAWTMYNTFGKNSSDYLVTSTKMAENYASRLWGYFIPRENVAEHRPGDIMSTSGHVWLSLGECDDGSVLLVHASPPGVKLSGTVARDGTSKSEAHILATEYMKRYRPQFTEKFPNMYPNRINYLKDYDRFTWDLTHSGIISDPDGIYNMKPQEILKILFDE